MKRGGAAALLEEQREAAVRYAQAGGERRLLRLLADAQKELEARLRRSVKGSWSEAKARAALAHVRHVVGEVQRGILATSVDGAKVGARRGARKAVDYVRAADAEYRGSAEPLAFDVARVLDRAAVGTEASVLHRLTGGAGGTKRAQAAKASVLSRYGRSTIAEFERVLRVGALTGKGHEEMVDAVTHASTFLRGAPRFWAERIVRTELAAAEGRATLDAGKAIADEAGGGMVKILSATFDGRTAWDSYAVHGQIRRLDEAFEWFDYRGRRQAYDAPPNRPNDREALVLHHVGWPIPKNLAPRPAGDYAARFREQYPHRPGPPRPTMSTVPAREFAKKQPRAVR